MNYWAIKRLQREFGYEEMQKLIDSGRAWLLEGSTGRAAMEMLKSGACMLPKKSYTDYYGNKIPSRTELKDGSKGTYQNSKTFYEEIMINW